MWLAFEPAEHAPRPLGRECHSLAAFGETLVLFGGNDKTQRLNDVYALDTGA